MTIAVVSRGEQTMVLLFSSKAMASEEVGQAIAKSAFPAL
jgi:hypothetical protein